MLACVQWKNGWRCNHFGELFANIWILDWIDIFLDNQRLYIHSGMPVLNPVNIIHWLRHCGRCVLGIARVRFYSDSVIMLVSWRCSGRQCRLTARRSGDSISKSWAFLWTLHVLPVFEWFLSKYSKPQSNDMHNRSFASFSTSASAAVCNVGRLSTRPFEIVCNRPLPWPPLITCSFFFFSFCNED